MYERITSQMTSHSTMADLNGALTKLQRTSQELSSGRSILEPSDDPYGASRAIDLQSTLDGLKSYAGSVSDATSWAQTASGAMSSIQEISERVRELMLQADNGTSSESDREYIAGEIDQLTEAIKQDANTQYAGQYIFAGTETNTQPYAYGEEDTFRGNTETVSRAIAPGTSVVVSSDLSSVLGNGAEAEDGKLLDVLRTISANLRGGSPEELQALAGQDLENLDANISALQELEAVSGSTIDQLQMATSRIEDLQLSTTSALSDTENTDYGTAAVEYSSAQAAYEAALRVGSSILQMPSLVDFLQ